MARLITRLDPIDRDIAVILNETMGPKAQARALQDHANRALKEGQDINRRALGYVPRHKTSVDGVPGAAVSSAKAESTIIFEFELLLELFDWIAAQLREKSPVGRVDDPRPRHPGLYKASHILLADGNQVLPGEQPPHAFEYAFVNTQPYSRKIERGQSEQAPNGVYEVVAKEASRRFGNIAKIRFGFRSLVGVSDLENWASGTSLQRKGRGNRPRRMNSAKRDEWLRRQPAVLVFVRDR